MEIIRMKNDSAEVITLIGSLDTITSPKLKPVLLEAIEMADQIELDLESLEYLSSAGLRVLLQGQKLAQKVNKTITMKNVVPEVMEVFDVTGLSGVFTII